MERHLEPLAIAANITQAAHCRLDTVLITFGFLDARYRAMTGPEDAIGCAAILASLEKHWLAADQNIFITTVIVNPLFQTTPFTPGPHFTNAHIQSLLGLLYSRFFQLSSPESFYTELLEYLMGAGQYSELVEVCSWHIRNSKRVVN